MTEHSTHDRSTEHTAPRHRRGGRWLLAFGALQLVVLSIGGIVVFARSLPSRPTLPSLLEMPLQIGPLYDDPRVVTDEQLSMVLTRLRPRLRQSQPKINSVDHALRFWGIESQFADPDCYSGDEMRQLLLNHSVFLEAWGDDAEPFLRPGPRGVAVRTRQGRGSSSHVDHTLASLAEVGTPLNYPVVTPGGEFQMRDLLQHAMRDFSLNQAEYEWTALSLALYAPTDRPWISSEGQQINFDLLAERIMRQPLSQGVCYGQHRLYTLAILLRIHADTPLFSDQGYQRVSDHLINATRKLVAHQSAEGWWDSNWPTEDRAKVDDNYGLLSNRMLATGHSLEWWAMAPEQFHPPREVVVRAGQWLVKELDAMKDDDVISRYPFLTHVGRALALWRGKSRSELSPLVRTQPDSGPSAD